MILAMNLSVAFCIYNESILALALQNKFGMTNAMIGFCFTLGALAYMLACSTLGIITSRIHRRYVMWFGFSMMIV
jgi:predicted MFS family arabinose efflux permease